MDSRKRITAERIDVPSDDDLNLFPGLAKFGSEIDKAIAKLKEHFEENDKHNRRFLQIEDGGKFAVGGLLERDLMQDSHHAMSPDIWENEAISAYYDQRTLVVFDYRLRWCRWLLNRLCLPYDRGCIVVTHEATGEVDSTAKRNGSSEPDLHVFAKL